MGSTPSEVELVVRWVLDGHASMRKTINTRITSYGLKHYAERKMGQYIGNDSFIEAMLKLGFKGRRIKDSENYFFNIKTPKEETYE
jgi:hypothetical protein